MCVLQRQFGGGDGAVYLGFRPGFFSEHMRIVLVRNSSDRGSSWGTAKLSFEDGAAPIKAPYSEGWVEKQHVRATLIDLKVSDLVPLNQAGLFRIRVGKSDFLFAPERVEAALKALEPCQKDLLVSWGMDKATIDSIATFAEPKGGIVSIFSSNDYPIAAIRKNEQGTAGVRYWVKKDGKVGDCKVVEPSGSATLDSQTCAIIAKRGTFQPAITKAGEAVDSIGFSRVHWLLPGN